VAAVRELVRSRRTVHPAALNELAPFANQLAEARRAWGAAPWDAPILADPLGGAESLWAALRVVNPTYDAELLCSKYMVEQMQLNLAKSSLNPKVAAEGEWVLTVELIRDFDEQLRRGELLPIRLAGDWLRRGPPQVPR
jgi:hypothetical protein